MKEENIYNVVCDSIAISDEYSTDFLTFDLSSTNSIEIAIVIGGDGICKILNSSIECKYGDLFIFNCDLPHAFFTKNSNVPLRILKISFSPKIFENTTRENISLLEELFKSGVPYSCSVLNSSAMNEMLRICGAIRREIDNRAVAWDKALISHLTLLLINLTRYNDLADAIEVERHKEWYIVFAAMSEISRSYSDSSLSLNTIAERLFIGRSTLSRAFSKATGISIHDYLQSVRLKQACAMLENTEMSNEEIALACGIKDLTTFYNTFKRKYGVTPLKYKKSLSSAGVCNNENPTKNIVAEINISVQNGRAKEAAALTVMAIEEGIPPEKILSEGLISAMDSVGERFKANQIFVLEVLMVAKAMNASLEHIRPLMGNVGSTKSGKVCIGTVRGDLHDIGKNLVKIMMEGRGIEVIDLGVDVAPERFIETAIAENCKIICLSALLTTTMPVMEEVVRAAEAAGIRDKVKIMIGGAPVSQAFCDQIGADAYSDDAATAADIAFKFCNA